jgi:hypothetical protein
MRRRRLCDVVTSSVVLRALHKIWGCMTSRFNGHLNNYRHRRIVGRVLRSTAFVFSTLNVRQTSQCAARLHDQTSACDRPGRCYHQLVRVAIILQWPQLVRKSSKSRSQLGIRRTVACARLVCMMCVYACELCVRACVCDVYKPCACFECEFRRRLAE